MTRFASATLGLALLASPAIAQQQSDPRVSTLTADWQAKAAIEAHIAAGITEILKAWDADKAALAAVTKERDELKAAADSVSK